MRVILAAVGKLKDSGERELFDRYHKRFDQAGRSLSLGPLTVVEHAESRLADAPGRKSEEASRLLKAVGEAHVMVALDEHGQHDTSEVFANRIGRQRDDGVKSLAFLIGGPDGHGDAVLAAADFKLSLGTFTLPHGLARVILAEQLYRATTILSGHPYHRS
jgi:23S rRNA (pseudouridine1915-N3)-methyltransferase